MRNPDGVGEGSGASAHPLFPIASLTPVSVARKELRRVWASGTHSPRCMRVSGHYIEQIGA